MLKTPFELVSNHQKSIASRAASGLIMYFLLPHSPLLANTSTGMPLLRAMSTLDGRVSKYLIYFNSFHLY